MMKSLIAVGIFCISMNLTIRQLQAQVNDPRIIECDPAHECSHRYINGQEFQVLESAGVMVAMAPDNGAFMPAFFSVTVIVTNNSDLPTDVVPDRFLMGIDTPKKELLKAIAPERVASIEHHGSDYAAIMKLAMRANTLDKTQNAIGSVFFKGNKKSTTAHIFLTVGEKVYAFPLKLR